MKVRFGIIGPGVIAEKFAADLAPFSDGELYGVASRDKAKATAFAEKFGAAKVYDSYEELAGDEAIDIVYISVTHNFHYDAVKLCLENGRRVICEKPMVLHESQAIELAELAKSKKLLLMEAMWTRCNPCVRTAKKWLDEGRLGDLMLIDASFCFRADFDPESRLFNPALAGGALYDVGVYVIEFATGIAGENPISVSGDLHRAPNGVDDVASMSLAFPSGALASLSCGISVWSRHNAWIYGTNGHVLLENFWETKSCKLFDSDGGVLDEFSITVGNRFNYEIEHIISLVRENKTESPLIPMRDTIATAAIFDKLLG